MKKHLVTFLWTAICLVLIILPSNMVSASAATPVYRFYNSTTQEHFFTSSAGERDHLMSRGWGNYEGISWYAPVTGDNIYRLYNPATDDHLYTRNLNEYNILRTQRGWNAEGVAFYSDSNQTVPVYRLYNPSLISGSHLYTTNANEVNVLVGRGWNYEGIAWYASSLPGQTANTTKVLGASFISQEAAGASMGCEAAASLQALQVKGYARNYDLKSFLKTMPIAANGNPYQGFGGTPYSVVSGVYQSIFPSALTPWKNRFGSAIDISGSNLDEIINQVSAGYPVIAWVTLNYQAPQWHQYNWGSGIDNAHVVTVDGYSNDSLHIVDPENGVYWVNKTTFTAAYNYMKFAVAVH